MRARFHNNPERTMLDRFNASEYERLLPRWRRARWRLTLFTVGAALVLVWAAASFWEAR